MLDVRAIERPPTTDRKGRCFRGEGNLALRRGQWYRKVVRRTVPNPCLILKRC